MSATEDIEALIEMMARLPGLGPRSARRAVLHLIARRGQLMGPLGEAMTEVARSVRECLTCGERYTTFEDDVGEALIEFSLVPLHIAEFLFHVKFLWD